MSLLTRKRQIAAKIKANPEGSAFETGTLAAAYADILAYEPKVNYDVQLTDRNPVRASLGSLAAVPGKRMAKITFGTEFKGSGTPGVAPSWGRLLRACGFSETASTGSEAIGSAVAHPKNTGTSPAPVIAIGTPGAFGVSGIIELQLIAKDTSNPENADFAATFHPGDGNEGSYGAVNITDSAFASQAFGGDMTAFDLTVNDPDGGGAGTPIGSWDVGDRWYFIYTSADAVDVTYKPISASVPLLDFGIYQDGRLHRISNARGNMKLSAKIGEPVMMNWEFWGICDVAASDVTDASLLTGIAFEDVVPAPFQGVTATLMSATPECFTNFELDLGNVLAARQCATELTGYDSIRLTDRNVTGSIDPEAVVVATFDPFTKLFAGTVGNLALLVGSTAGNITEITASNVQITNITDDDRDGIGVDTLALRFNEPEFDAGGDYAEITIIAR